VRGMLSRDVLVRHTALRAYMHSREQSPCIGKLEVPNLVEGFPHVTCRACQALPLHLATDDFRCV
jgi:hypothetical protein